LPSEIHDANPVSDGKRFRATKTAKKNRESLRGLAAGATSEVREVSSFVLLGARRAASHCRTQAA
jgi:hypothetical protein